MGYVENFGHESFKARYVLLPMGGPTSPSICGTNPPHAGTIRLQVQLCKGRKLDFQRSSISIDLIVDVQPVGVKSTSTAASL